MEANEIIKERIWVCTAAVAGCGRCATAVRTILKIMKQGSAQYSELCYVTTKAFNSGRRCGSEQNRSFVSCNPNPYLMTRSYPCPAMSTTPRNSLWFANKAKGVFAIGVFAVIGVGLSKIIRPADFPFPNASCACLAVVWCWRKGVVQPGRSLRLEKNH